MIFVVVLDWLIMVGKWRFCGTRIQEKTLWCAEIELEKQRNGDEIWGTVEWVDGVLPLPDERYKFVEVLAVTL